MNTLLFIYLHKMIVTCKLLVKAYHLSLYVVKAYFLKVQGFPILATNRAFSFWHVRARFISPFHDISLYQLLMVLN